MWFRFDRETGAIYLSHSAIEDVTTPLARDQEKAQAVKLLLMRVASAERILLDPDGCFDVWRNVDREAWGFRQNEQGEPLVWPLQDGRR